MSDLDPHLRSAAPPVGDVDLDAIWARVAPVLTAESGCGATEVARPSLLRRRLRTRHQVVAWSVGLLLAASGTAAAADYLATRTGEHLTGWEVAAGGSGEVLRLDGTDARSVLTAQIADIPFPDSATRESVLAIELKSAGTDAFTTTSAVRGVAADFAICAWADQWAATRANDPARAVAAAATLQSALSWSAVTDLDPAPSMTGHQGDQGTAVPSRFGHLAGAVSAIGHGSVSELQVALAGKCGPEHMPHVVAEAGR